MKAMLAEVAAHNKELAAAHRLQYATRQELEATSLPALNNEDLTKAMDEYGRIRRRDMFRGFTVAQRRRIMRDNEVIMQMRREALEAERREDEAWVLQQLAQARAMEQVLYEERCMREEALSDQMRTLSWQMQQNEERKRVYNKDRFGGIGDEFFERFGKDCR